MADLITKEVNTSNPIAVALRELIRLKDLKTDALAIETSGSWSEAHRQQGMLREYHAARDKAWDAARRALTEHALETCEQRIDLDAAMWAAVKEAIVKSPHFQEMFEAGGMLNDAVSNVVSMLLGPLPYVHLNKGGRDPDEKLYSALDVEAMLAVGSALHAHKANTLKAEEQRGESRAEFERDRGFVRRCPKCNRDVSSGCNYCACPYPQSPAVSEGDQR